MKMSFKGVIEEKQIILFIRRGIMIFYEEVPHLVLLDDYSQVTNDDDDDDEFMKNGD